MKTKFLSFALAAAAVLVTTGCDTVGGPLGARFNPPPVERVIEAAPDRVFEAAVDSLREMGYVIRSARARRGEIEAYGRLGIDDRFLISNQHSCRVWITETLDGTASVRLEVREQVEERLGAAGMRQSEQVLPLGGIHDRFYEELQSRLPGGS